MLIGNSLETGFKSLNFKPLKSGAWVVQTIVNRERHNLDSGLIMRVVLFMNRCFWAGNKDWQSRPRFWAKNEVFLREEK